LLLIGDVRDKIKEVGTEKIQAIITSPPYWGLRNYGKDDQIGQEETPDEFVKEMVGLCREFKRVLKKDGTFWLNLGDTYFGAKGGHWSSDNSFTNEDTGTKYREHRKAPPKHPFLKTKDLVGVPWRVALGLQQDGWYLRNDIIWAKNNPMPEAVKDRFAKSHEHIFLLSKSPKYKFFYEEVLEPYTEPLNRWGGDNFNSAEEEESKYGVALSKELGYSHQNADGKGKNVRPNPKGKTRKDVWKLNTSSYGGAHFAVFPETIPEIAIKAGTEIGDTVLDPFMGSGTTAVMATRLKRKWVGIEMNEEYADIIKDRTSQLEMF
jgi:DNA modification methylase